MGHQFRLRLVSSLIVVMTAVTCGEDVAPCSSTADCSRSETCDTEAGECVPLQTEGGSCFADTDCAEPLQCVFDVCKSGEEGSDCFGDDDCNENLHCNLELSGCATGGSGQVCGVDDDCDEPLICSYATNPSTCHEKAQIGEPCGLDSDCAGHESGVVCVYAFNPPLCREPGQQGDPCAANSDCMPGLVCAGDVIGMLTCTPQPAP